MTGQTNMLGKQHSEHTVQKFLLTLVRLIYTIITLSGEFKKGLSQYYAPCLTDQNIYQRQKYQKRNYARLLSLPSICFGPTNRQVGLSVQGAKAPCTLNPLMLRHGSKDHVQEWDIAMIDLSLCMTILFTLATTLFIILIRFTLYQTFDCLKCGCHVNKKMKNTKRSMH